MTNIKISNRLKTIGDLIKEGSNVVDVGCDHGLLSIYIYLKLNNVNIIASDINEKPLESACSNLKKYKLEKKIKLVLSDGLNNIKYYYDTIIISGVGGNTIIDILRKEKLKDVNSIILSPQNSIYLVRKHLNKLGYYINNEIILKENNMHYIIIEFKKGKKRYNNDDLLFGPILLRNRNNLFIEYLNKKYNKYNKILYNIPKNKIYKRFLLKIYLKKIKTIL